MIRCPWVVIAVACFLVGYWAARSWIHYYTFMDFYVNRFPAQCSEGRPLEDRITSSRLDIDDTYEDDDGQVTMHCYIPVFVYFRETQALEDKQLKKENDQFELEKDHSWKRTKSDQTYAAWERMTGKPKDLGDWANADGSRWMQDDLEQWRSRDEPVDVVCNRDGRPTIGAYYPHCSSLKWECATGKCNAYEKTRRLCAAEIRRDRYPCFYIPGEPEAGVHPEGETFVPLMWLAVACAMSVLLVQCVCLVCVAVRYDCKRYPIADDLQEDIMNEISGSMGHVGGGTIWICCGVCFIILLGVIYTRCYEQTTAPDDYPAKGKITYSLADLLGVEHPAEKLVVQSFWTFPKRWYPSPVVQVGLIAGLGLITLMYQTWYCFRKVRWTPRCMYVILPQDNPDDEDWSEKEVIIRTESYTSVDTELACL